MRNVIVSFKQSGCIERNINVQKLPEHQKRVSKNHHATAKNIGY